MDRKLNIQESGQVSGELLNIFNSILNETNAIVFSLDKEFRYTSYNRAHEEAMLTIYGKQVYLGGAIIDCITVEKDREKAMESFHRTLTGESVVELSFLGSEELTRRFYRLSHSPVRNPDNEITGVLVVANDITEQRLTEVILASRFHLIEYSLTHSYDELLEETLSETEKLTGSFISFFHFIDSDQKTLRLQTWSKRTMTEFCKSEAHGLHYEIDKAGVWVECFYKRRAVIHNDYDSLPGRKGLPEGHVKIKRELTVPVFRNKKIVAILGVGNKPADYTEHDIEVVSLIADLAWEIASRKRAEETQAFLNRELNAIRNCNQTLLRTTDENELLNEVCRIICEEAGYIMAWVGYKGNDREKAVIPVASAGKVEGYLEDVRFSWDEDSEIGHAPAGIAIRKGEIVQSSDFESDPMLLPWREHALQRGYRSNMALPLKNEQDEVFGALVLYYDHPNTIKPEEVSLLSQLVGDLAFGISVIRDRIKKKETETALAKSEYRQTLFNKIASVFLTLSDDEMYGEVLSILLNVTGSRYGLFGYINDNGDLSVPSLTEEIWENSQMNGKAGLFPKFMWGRSIWGRSIIEKRSFVSNGPFHTPHNHVKIQNAITVPLIFANQVIGLIALANNSDNYTDEDLAFVEDIAGFIAPVLNARLQRDKLEEIRLQYEADLIREKERAEVSDKLKSAFLHNISHEIRTPMNAICGFTEFLGIPDLSPEKREEFVDIIKQSSKQLLSVVSDIITISSIESQQEVPEISIINVDDILETLHHKFEPVSCDRKIKFSTYRDENLQNCEIYTDGNKLTRILDGLLSNAFKFTQEGFIEFGYKLDPATPTQLEFFVRDSGIGIDKNMHNRIFERFMQGNDDIHQAYGGTGLGLSISKGLVELLGGVISVESEPSKGSVFSFTIPYRPNLELHSFISDSLVRNGSPRVLVAEDEDMNFFLLEEVFKDLNVKIIRAYNGQEAVNIFREVPGLDLVLMDIKMPVMDGYEAACIIRQIRPDVKIIAQTAYALSREVEKYRSIFDDYLTKPINVKDLKSKVRAYLI